LLHFFASIKSRVILATLLLLFLVFTIPGLFLLSQFERNFTDRSLNFIDLTQRIVYTAMARNMAVGLHGNLQETIDSLAGSRAIRQLSLADSAGIIRYSYPRQLIGTAVADLQTLVAAPAPFIDRNTATFSDWRRLPNDNSCRSCHPAAENLGYVGVVTNFSKAERYFYTGATHIYFLLFATFLIIGFGLYLALRYFLGGRLVQLSTAIGAIEAGNYNTRLQASRNDEIAALEAHFNRMVTQIGNSRAEIEKLHNEQIQRADQMVTLGELAAEMAHEVNNPAAIIMSRADYLSYEAGSNKCLSEYADDISAVLNQTKKISRITQNILRYSKRPHSEKVVSDINTILRGSLVLLEPRMQKKGLLLEEKYGRSLPGILADPMKLEQVFINIINNAIDASPRQGKIGLQTDIEDERVAVRISDNGSGIAAEELEQIFAPFFTTKQGHKGTGLGLYVVRNILNDHKATIRCQSKQGEGSTFIITFN
jgi:signal transduction histidine kinase